MVQDNQVDAKQIFAFANQARTNLHHPFIWNLLFLCYEMGFVVEKNRELGKKLLLEDALAGDVSAMIASYLIQGVEYSPFSPDEISQFIPTYISAAEKQLPYFPLSLLALEYSYSIILPEDKEKIYQFFVNHPSQICALVRDGFQGHLFGLCSWMSPIEPTDSEKKLFELYLKEVLEDPENRQLPFLSKLLPQLKLEPQWKSQLEQKFGKEKLASWVKGELC